MQYRITDFEKDTFIIPDLYKNSDEDLRGYDLQRCKMYELLCLPCIDVFYKNTPAKHNFYTQHGFIICCDLNPKAYEKYKHYFEMLKEKPYIQKVSNNIWTDEGKIKIKIKFHNDAYQYIEDNNKASNQICYELMLKQIIKEYWNEKDNVNYDITTGNIVLGNNLQCYYPIEKRWLMPCEQPGKFIFSPKPEEIHTFLTYISIQKQDPKIVKIIYPSLI